MDICHNCFTDMSVYHRASGEAGKYFLSTSKPFGVRGLNPNITVAKYIRAEERGQAHLIYRRDISAELDEENSISMSVYNAPVEIDKRVKFRGSVALIEENRNESQSASNKSLSQRKLNNLTKTNELSSNSSIEYFPIHK